MKDDKVPDIDIQQYLQEKNEMYLMDDIEEYGTPDHDINCAPGDSTPEESVLAIEQSYDQKEASVIPPPIIHHTSSPTTHQDRKNKDSSDTFAYTYPRNQ